MKAFLRSLWRGELPLARMLLVHMLATGTIVNIVGSAAALVAFAAGLPVAAGLGLHFAPIPYNMLLLVGVWQSAARQPSAWSWPAQAVALLWFLAVLIV